MKTHLQKLLTNWEWEVNNLKLSGINNLLKIIESLKISEFSPYLTKSIQQHHMHHLNVQKAHEISFNKSLNLQESGDIDGDTIHSLQHDFVDVSDMNVGSLTFEAPSEEELLNIKKELSKLSENILEPMKKRI